MHAINPSESIVSESAFTVSVKDAAESCGIDLANDQEPDQAQDQNPDITIFMDEFESCL